jgi:hypothetical protein
MSSDGVVIPSHIFLSIDDLELCHISLEPNAGVVEMRGRQQLVRLLESVTSKGRGTGAGKVIAA